MPKSEILAFDEFKKSFYQRFPDIRVFDCGEWNFVKVVLDGLKVNYARRPGASHHWETPIWYWKLRQRVKHISSKQGELQDISWKQWTHRKFLAIEHSGRYVNDVNGTNSIYLQRPVDALSRQNTVIVSEVRPPHDADIDLVLPQLELSILRHVPDEYEMKLRIDLTHFFDRLIPLLQPDEQLSVGVALEKFYKEFRLWNKLLQFLPQQNVLMLCHYHHEGMIAAMRKHGRKVLELQHGLIATNDIFYCFPENIIPVRKKALFPDVLLVYGEYWKQTAQRGFEWEAGQVQTIGYFLSEPVNHPNDDIRLSFLQTSGPIILITTQTMLHELFIKYINNLSGMLTERGISATILVKPHPAEKSDTYQSIADLPHVVLTNVAITMLFAHVQCQVSIYSTTLFDGLRFGVPGFALDIDKALSGYVEPLIAEGIAARLGIHENPLDHLDRIKERKEPAYYYEKFQPEKMVELIEAPAIR